ncbi:MAG: M48 family metallopeptidase [Limisphaerales bacterium]|jgi:predicted Zn-dependent protease
MRNRSFDFFALLGLGLAVCIGAGCTTVSETGRRQLILLSPEQESSLGATSFSQMKGEQKISSDAAANSLVQRVGERISAVAPLPNAAWEFVVFDSPEANAFCLPGGKVGVYSGILQVTQTEAGLAAVMGHEVAHAVARHGAERMSEAMLMQLGGAAVELGMQQTELDPAWQTAAVSAYGLGASVGRALPHSRKQESEADFMGLLYMARAGYDPEEAIRFWERFKAFNEAEGGSGTPWFLRTHPLDDTRIQQLREWLPQARSEYRPAGR